MKDVGTGHIISKDDEYSESLRATCMMYPVTTTDDGKVYLQPAGDFQRQEYGERIYGCCGFKWGKECPKCHCVLAQTGNGFRTVKEDVGHVNNNLDNNLISEGSYEATGWSESVKHWKEQAEAFELREGSMESEQDNKLALIFNIAVVITNQVQEFDSN